MAENKVVLPDPSGLVPMEEMEAGQFARVVSRLTDIDGDLVFCAHHPQEETGWHVFVSLQDGGYYRPDEYRILVEILPAGTPIRLTAGSVS